MATDCVFCRIALGEIPADTIYQDDQVTAFEFLESGRVDAIALTNISLNWMLEQREAEGDFEVTDGFIPVIDG
jgi:polar amino acid transport system substrate-binding protein